MIDDDALLDDRIGIIGTSGAGKSFTMRRMAERLLALKRHTILLDPNGVHYGLRSNAAGTGPGFDIPILGGPHGDLPINPGGGARLADLLFKERVSAVIDLSEFEERELQRFALDFLDRLRERERVNLHIIFDEAEEFAPQTPGNDVAFELIQRMAWIAKKGRTFGLVPMWVTQRPADFNKSVLALAQTLIFHALIAPADQTPAINYLKAHADKATLEQVRGSLASLETGQRWIYSPRRRILELGVSPPIATFDSMMTPAPGEAKREPRTLAELDVTALRKALAPPLSDPSIPTDPVEAYAVGAAAGEMIIERDRRIDELEQQTASQKDFIEILQAQVRRHRRIGCEAYELLGRLANSPTKIDEAPEVGSEAGEGHQVDVSPSPIISETSTDAIARRVGRGVAGDAESPQPSPAATENPMATRIVDKLHLLAPARLTWRQLATILGYKPDGGYFRKGKRDALASGAILEQDEYVRFAGSAGAYGSLDRAGALDLWRGIIREPGPKIIDYLDEIASNDGWVFKGRLADGLGYSPDGGYFRAGLALLRQNGVIEESGTDVRIARLVPGQAA